MRAAAFCCLLLGCALTLNGQEAEPEVTLGDGTVYNYETDTRSWSDVSGKFSVVARIERFLQSGSVRFRKAITNERIDVPINALSENDRELLSKIKKRKEVVEKLEKENAMLRKFTHGWDELLAARRGYLLNLEAIFGNAKLSKFEKEQKLLELHNKLAEMVPIEVSVVVLVKDLVPMIDRNGKSTTGAGGVFAIKPPFRRARIRNYLVPGGCDKFKVGDVVIQTYRVRFEDKNFSEKIIKTYVEGRFSLEPVRGVEVGSVMKQSSDALKNFWLLELPPKKLTKNELDFIPVAQRWFDGLEKKYGLDALNAPQ